MHMTIDLGLIKTMGFLASDTDASGAPHTHTNDAAPTTPWFRRLCGCMQAYTQARENEKQILLPSSTRAHLSQPKLIHKQIKWLGTYTQPHKRVLVCKNLNTLPPATCQEAEAALSETRSSIVMPRTTRQETARTAPDRRRFSFWLHLNYIANHRTNMYIFIDIYIYIFQFVMQ